MSHQTTAQQQEFSIMELIEAIYTSELPEGKKLAYLSMIADGSFSLDHLDGLLKDLEEVDLQLQQKKKQVVKSLDELEAKKEKLEDELMELQVKAAEEMLVNAEKLVDAVTEAEERSSEFSNKKTIENLKSKLNKNQ